LKKGEIAKGIISYVDFPDKGIIKNMGDRYGQD
jgi:hypothetical protein